ncbi:antiterminator Q family protein [Edwardsiella tarda]
MRDISKVLECWGGWAASDHAGLDMEYNLFVDWFVSEYRC